MSAEQVLAQIQAEVTHDHEQRLRALEAFRWKLVGIAAAFGGAGAALGHLLGGG